MAAAVQTCRPTQRHLQALTIIKIQGLHLSGFFSSFLFFQTNEIWDDCRFLNTLHIDTTSRFYFASLFEDDINIFSRLIHYCYSFLPLRWRRLASAELLHKLPDTSVRCFMSGIWRSVACLWVYTCQVKRQGLYDTVMILIHHFTPHWLPFIFTTAAAWLIFCWT